MSVLEGGADMERRTFQTSAFDPSRRGVARGPATAEIVAWLVAALAATKEFTYRAVCTRYEADLPSAERG